MRYKIVSILLAVVGLLLAGTNVEKIIKKIQKKYKNISVMKVDFKQISEFKLTGIKNEIFGTLYLTQNDKFRLETEDQVIVSDGKTFWRYNKLDNQVLIDYAKKSQQDVFLNNFLFQINDLYYSQVVDEFKEKNHKIYVVKLTPKNPDESFFQYIKVWIQDKTWLLKKVLYVDYNDNESVYEIETLEINPPVTDKTFTFQIPEGVEVVDLR